MDNSFFMASFFIRSSIGNELSTHKILRQINSVKKNIYPDKKKHIVTIKLDYFVIDLYVLILNI